MAAPRAAAGFTAAFIPASTRTSPTSASRVDYLGHGWGFSWPNDVRILYNRCSARPDGKPWSERKKLVWWDEEKQEWTGHDRPDFDKKKRPDYQPPAGRQRAWMRIAGDKPFVLHPDGVAWLYVTSGLKDGPLPTHYEPLESPFGNALYPEHVNQSGGRSEGASRQRLRLPRRRTLPVRAHDVSADRASHGGRHVAPALAPGRTCSRSCSARFRPSSQPTLNLEHGDWATIMTPRGLVEARVLVTPRMRPLWVEGRTVHQVGLPYHWGYNGLVKGDVANDLLVISEEPNVRIMETKALVCDIEPGRRARGARGIGAMEGTHGAAGMSTTTAFLHRLDALHRLQGLRGRLQGMERPRRRRLQLDRQLLRQHGRGRPLDLAPCEVRGRHAPEPGFGGNAGDLVFVGIFFRRLQALRRRRLPRGVSHGSHRAHRVRRRLRAARRLQWLRATAWWLVPSAWCSAIRRTAAPSSAPSVTTGRKSG